MFISFVSVVPHNQGKTKNINIILPDHLSCIHIAGPRIANPICRVQIIIGQRSHSAGDVTVSFIAFLDGIRVVRAGLDSNIAQRGRERQRQLKRSVNL